MANEMLRKLCSGLPLNPLPPRKTSRHDDVPHAPDRKPVLTENERKVNDFNRMKKKNKHKFKNIFS